MIPSSSETAAPLRARILVVDDEAGVRDLLSEYLSAEGYGVTQASTG